MSHRNQGNYYNCTTSGTRRPTPRQRGRLIQPSPRAVADLFGIGLAGRYSRRGVRLQHQATPPGIMAQALVRSIIPIIPMKPIHTRTLSTTRGHLLLTLDTLSL